MKEGRKEGERRRDINEGRKEGNTPETRVPTQHFREEGRRGEGGREGRERERSVEKRKRGRKSRW